VGYRIEPGAPESRVVLHVPHAATAIPPEVRAGLLLDDAELATELASMTDAGTDVVAAGAAQRARVRPWAFVNELSRLVVDPERFPDGREAMAAVGMGAVYTRTSDGRPLRTDEDPGLVVRWFEPYAGAVTELVRARLDAVGAVTIVDVHSYPVQRLPYERGGAHRPAICIGTDDYHTPQWLVDLVTAAFADCGESAVNTPFAGCYVPLAHYGVDPRVTGVMIEARRDVGPELLVPGLTRLIDGL
jgi:predicted N-formylglutamate amidohydrolase